MSELLTLWSDNSAVSTLIWMAIAIVVLYLGRKQAHNMLASSGRLIYSNARIGAFTLQKLETLLAKRNKDVLLAMGASQCKKVIEREFSRVNAKVNKELNLYPALHHKIASQIQKIEADYQATTQGDVMPPAWTEVVETINALPSNGDATVAKVLNNIKQAVTDSHQQSLKALQKSNATRHKILSTMQPDWRKVDKNLEDVKKTVDGLTHSSEVIDKQMESYEAIVKQEDSAVAHLASSSLTQLFVAGLVLGIAILGGLINFQLIAMPMSEMVGGASYIGNMKTSDVAALVIILIEIAMGLFFLESLRVTHLFPLIGSMDDKMRRKMVWVSFSILAILAGIEASLAYMRDILALDREALQQSLMGNAPVGVVEESDLRWIPSLGQMIMGFILPFALAFIAIPLESFVHSLRDVIGMITLGLLRLIRIALRMVGALSLHLSRMLMHLYDLIIVVPMSLETLIRHLLNNAAKDGQSTNQGEFEK